MDVKRIKWLTCFSFLMAVGLLVSACAQPTPEVIEKVITDVVKEVEVEKEVTRIVEVEKEVTREPTPLPAWFNSEQADRYGGVLTVPIGDFLPTLDVHSSVVAVLDMTLTPVWEGLIGLGEDFSIIPILAERYELSPDNRTYTFYLRQGVKFHNGQELTAQDVEASFTRYLEVSPGREDYALIERFEAVDDRTFSVHLSKPSASMLVQLGIDIFPKDIIEGKAADDLAVPDDLVGTGPYRIAEYKPDQFLRLVRFEGYVPLPGERDGYGGAKIPYFDEILYPFVPEWGARTAGFEAGEYGIVEMGPLEYDLYKDNPYIKVQITRPEEKNAIVFNHREWPSSELKFRQAVNAAVDLKSVGLALVDGREEFIALNYSLWPVHSYWYYPNPEHEKIYNEFDIEKAQRLLNEIGYAGEEIVIASLAPDTWCGKPLSVVADQLKQAGFNVRMDVYDWPTLFDMWLNGGDWHISDNGWIGACTIDPSYYRCQFDSEMEENGTRFGFSNPEMSQIFDDAEEAGSLEERKEVFHRLQDLYYENLPSLVYGDGAWVYGIRHDIEGFQSWLRPRYWGVWRED